MRGPTLHLVEQWFCRTAQRRVPVRNPLDWLKEVEVARTLDEVYRQGLEALRDRLGRADMIRFLQQFERGSGDYAKERHAWVDRTSMAGLLEKSGRKQTKRTKRRGGRPSKTQGAPRNPKH